MKEAYASFIVCVMIGKEYAACMVILSENPT